MWRVGGRKGGAPHRSRNLCQPHGCCSCIHHALLAAPRPSPIYIPLYRYAGPKTCTHPLQSDNQRPNVTCEDRWPIRRFLISVAIRSGNCCRGTPAFVLVDDPEVYQCELSTDTDMDAPRDPLHPTCRHSDSSKHPLSKESLRRGKDMRTGRT